MNQSDPVGVFDSGLGGVSVLRELVKLMPGEDYVYFGDSKNAPYGVKTEDEIMALSLSGAEFLVKAGVKAIVIGCNTITSVAAAKLRSIYSDIIIVATEPAVKPAALASPGGVVVVMATDATLRGEKFHALAHLYEGKATIKECPCPGLMEFVERGDIRSQELRRYLEDRFQRLGLSRVDGVVLGCTHYPFVKDMIKEVLGENVKIFDGAPAIARQLRRKLYGAGILNSRDGNGTIDWRNSSPDPKYIKLGKKLLSLQ